MAVKKVTGSDEYRAYCELILVKSVVSKMIYLMRTAKADDAVVLEAVQIAKMIDELKDIIDDMMLDGYFKDLSDKIQDMAR